MTNSGRVEYIFARFAWAVLYLIKSFLISPRQQTLLARFRIWEDGVLQEKEEYLAPREIDQLFGGGGSKSASSRKRSRTTSSQSAVDWELEPSWNETYCHDDQHHDGYDDDRHIGEWCEQVEPMDAEPKEVDAQWDDQVYKESRPPVRGRKRTREEDEEEDDDVVEIKSRSKRRRADTSNALDSAASLANTGTFSGGSPSNTSSPVSLRHVFEESSQGNKASGPGQIALVPESDTT